ncbi:MAG: hypothetical protein ACYDEQ_06095 [Desulfocucumaceae bacterium]
MVELLGWLGFLLLAMTLLPFVLKRLPVKSDNFFCKHHPALAIASVAVLTLHGILALTGRHGWQWLARFNGDMLTGLSAWLVLLAVVLLALYMLGKKHLLRRHCWLAIALVLLVFLHV